MTVSASGEGNIDGGGGGMGSGTATDVWHNQDGVRITVAGLKRLLCAGGRQIR